MNILDEIRNRAVAPTVAPREDVLAPQEQESLTPDVDETSTADSSVSELARLEEQLANFPEIAPRLPVRLEVEIKQELDELCSQEKITVETLLEAFYVTCKEKDSVMNQVLKEAKKRLKARKEAGNIRSSMTRLANLAKKLK
ncbi:MULTISPECIES: hypothetical protein [unclassified Tolypothrix]|uniref:hypothetical protein n=1 Tax=unclassified Tolypothrix TaxID=2649714 RepID=UPI0005EAAB3E|nr:MULTISPECIES: hypothetical protein [unclassified Tolypothrix]BAY95883.1 hypothetical protein NIES3275_79600 [Microchaete diplosiphon NIES-3275]EKE96813.1 hypothetical protein FDUTEX481_06356 [Tolypothrix sp. PCC 7601]MBE9083915.1 hypothetical protein [Tolypothrix sp. LEGE 11397]UYD30980.1 hypothetical protein HGR01_39575 [Tolypothrix sp. PCC 7712]UYD38832.1 hypothetical protein HG267_40810 [Tolypothrix sp. PCC 7601]